MNPNRSTEYLFGFEKVCDWYEKSVIDYRKQYSALYTAYNAWYREVLSTTNDRQAVTALKKRYVIWEEYCDGRAMHDMKSLMERLADLTQKEPLHCQSPHWNGEINGVHDWQSLIEYWYQVRCIVVHGGRINLVYVWLAYQTLDIFMSEIIHRVGRVLKGYTSTHLKDALTEFEFLDGGSERTQAIRQKMFLKYVGLPDIWQVDMTPIRAHTE